MDRLSIMESFIRIACARSNAFAMSYARGLMQHCKLILLGLLYVCLSLLLQCCGTLWFVGWCVSFDHILVKTSIHADAMICDNRRGEWNNQALCGCRFWRICHASSLIYILTQYISTTPEGMASGCFVKDGKNSVLESRAHVDPCC
jgi:hypothetical protein